MYRAVERAALPFRRWVGDREPSCIALGEAGPLQPARRRGARWPSERWPWVRRRSGASRLGASASAGWQSSGPR